MLRGHCSRSYAHGSFSGSQPSSLSLVSAACTASSSCSSLRLGAQALILITLLRQ
jgi:hypothetical protein